MRKTRYFIMSILLASISLFCCFDQLRAQIDETSVIINKSYKQYSLGPNHCHAPYTSKSLLNENNLWLKSCNGSYLEVPQGESSVVVPIAIDIYSNANEIKDIYLFVLIQERPIHSFITIQHGGNILVANYPGRQIHQYISWISKNFIVQLSSFNAKMPEGILNDYLIKYPPTVKFQPSDLSDESLIKNYYLQGLVIIEQKDRARMVAHGKNKNDEYEAMVIQCQLEAGTRCVLGKNTGKYSDCPTTLEQDPIKRKKAIQELRKELLATNIKKEKITFMHLPYGTCAYNPETRSQILKSIK